MTENQKRIVERLKSYGYEAQDSGVEWFTRMHWPNTKPEEDCLVDKNGAISTVRGEHYFLLPHEREQKEKERRYQEIIKVALSYLYSNVDDANEAMFESDLLIHVQGQEIAPIREDEVEAALNSMKEEQ
jgi:hypothetical protein